MEIKEKLKKKLREWFPLHLCFNCGKELHRKGMTGIQPIYCTEKCRKEHHKKQDMEVIE